MSSHQRVRSTSVLLLSFSLVMMADCRADDTAGASPSHGDSAADKEFQQALQRLPSPTAQEAQKFADAVGQVIYLSNPQAWQGIVDWETFLDLCFTGIKVHPNSQKGFRQGFLGNLNTQSGFFAQVHNSLGQFGSYELVRLHEVEGRQRALFRLVNSEGGLNYHDYILIRDSEGRPRAIDMYIYLTGEALSTTIRRMIQQLAREEGRGFLDRLAGNQQESLKNVEALGSMSQSIQRGDAAEALKTYKALPQHDQRDKSLLIQRYLAATMIANQQQSFEEITATVDLFRDAHPQDACLDFMALDYHMARKEYDQTRQAVDRLDKAVGGDPYLNEIRGNIFYQAGQVEEAVKHYELAIAALPHRGSAYFSLIGIALEQKDHAATLAGLKRLDQAVMMEWTDFTQVPEYADFVESPYYAQWKEYLESKPAP